MRNCAEAMEWYLLAAAQGFVKAQMELSGLYTKGDGVQQDDAQAFYWCSRAATQGEALAQCYLGSLYFRGKGVNQDYVLAYMYFSLAAAQDQEDAIRGRDLASQCMDAEQIAEAQRLAREWRSNQLSEPETTQGR
jgi:TPR repeat protein